MAAQSKNKTPQELSKALRESTQTLVSAHRGGGGLKDYPENALESINYLYHQNIRVFEIDIIQTADDELMLLHDDFLDRTTNSHGSIDGLSSQDLLKMNLVDDFGNETPYKIPYLKDVLTWVKGKDAYLMIDFKKNVSYEKVIDLIKAQGVQGQCVLISYSIDQAKKLHQLAPAMQLSVSARNEKELNWLLETDIPTDKMIAFTGTRLSEVTLYKRLNQLKIPAILGTLGNLDKRAAAKGDDLYKKWATLGIQFIATDRPLQVYKALQ